MTKQGFFLTFEGIHGVGKSTIVTKLIKKLSEKGYETVYLQAQSGTPIGKELRKINLGFEDLSPLAEALIVGAARHQCVKDVIKPNLRKGKFVICERFSDAFMADGFARGRKEDLMETINQAIIDGETPDLTILIDSDPKKAIERIPIEKRHRFEKENLEFHSQIGRAHV